MSRPLTTRERAVLDALCAVDCDGVHDLREQAENVVVVGGCPCGCPSIDFYREPGAGLRILVNAAVEGTNTGLFLLAVADRLGGIEWVNASDGDDPAEFPAPTLLTITPA